MQRVLAAIERRHGELVELLTECTADELDAASMLPGWSKLTIACHLRYGAEATLRLTRAAIEGTEASFYPGGRDQVRSQTLVPRPAESAADVVRSLAASSSALDRLWGELPASAWAAEVREPDGHRDLGTVSLQMLALLRLTEVEVHGSDLDVGAQRWSDTFVDEVLPMRLQWLTKRRSNHRSVGDSIVGRWVLRATDGPSFAVEASSRGVVVSEITDAAGADNPVDTATVTATKHELLAFILGRMQPSELVGDAEAARRFLAVFPPP